MIRQHLAVGCFSRRLWFGREYSSLIRNPKWMALGTHHPSVPIVRSALSPQPASFVTITQTKRSDPTIDAMESVEISSDTPSPNEVPEIPSNNTAEALNVTESCWARIQYLTRDNPDTYLRLFVDAGGCSGFTYQFELDTAPLDKEEDIVYAMKNDESIRLVVDTASLGFLQGATIDYVQEMIKSAFAVTENPQSESACGCGSSFALKNFAANPAMD